MAQGSYACMEGGQGSALELELPGLREGTVAGEVEPAEGPRDKGESPLKPQEEPALTRGRIPAGPRGRDGLFEEDAGGGSFRGIRDTCKSTWSQNQGPTLNESPRSRPQCSLSQLQAAGKQPGFHCIWEGAWGSHRVGIQAELSPQLPRGPCPL